MKRKKAKPAKALSKRPLAKKQKYKRQVKNAVNFISQSLGQVWNVSKNKTHEHFLIDCSHYFGLQFEPIPLIELHFPTKDTNLIHTPLAKDIDQTIERQVESLRSSRRLQKAQSMVDELIFQVNMGINGMQLHNDTVTVIQFIWDGAPIQYFIDDKKKNCQMFSYIVTLFTSSIAHLARIDNSYSVSNEIYIPEQNLKGWSSAPAVSLGLDGFRVSQGECPMSQMGLILESEYGTNLADLMIKPSERFKNTTGKLATSFVGKEKSITSKNYMIGVDGKPGKFSIGNLSVTDRNGFGIPKNTKNESEYALAAGMLGKVQDSILHDRSRTIPSEDGNSVCNIRLLSRGDGNRHDMKLSFIGIYDEGKFDPNGVEALTRIDKIYADFVH